MDKKFIINKYISFPSLLKFLPNSENTIYGYYGKIFCPFHYNINTPAAKLFKDEGGDTLYCYSEQKLYRPYDLIQRNMIPYTEDDVYNFIASRVDLTELEEKDSKYIPKFNLYRKEFSEGDLSLREYIDYIVNHCGVNNGN